MLNALSIRDIVLIERTRYRARKRADRAFRRNRRRKIDPARCPGAGARRPRRCKPGAPRRRQGRGHRRLQPAAAAIRPSQCWTSRGSAADREIVLRRVQGRDGTSRAFINDQPASVALLRQVGGLMAEIHGQHDNRALFDVDASPWRCSMPSAISEAEREQVAARLRGAAGRRGGAGAAPQHGRAGRGGACLHRACRWRSCAPPRRIAGEEEELAGQRQLHDECRAVRRCRRRDAPGARCRRARLPPTSTPPCVKLERRRQQAAGLLDELIAALERVATEVAEATRILDAAERSVAFDQGALEARRGAPLRAPLAGPQAQGGGRRAAGIAGSLRGGGAGARG